MLIAFVIHSLRGGGAEFVTRSWAEELASREHEVVVVLTHPKAEEPTPAGVRVLRLPRAGLPGLGRSRILALRRVLDEVRPDVAMAMLTQSNLLLTAATRAASPRPAVVISERNMPDRLAADRGRARTRLDELLIRRLYPAADGFVAISHPVAAAFAAAAKLDADRLTIVLNPAVASSGIGPFVPRTHSGRIHLAVPGRLVDKKRPRLALDVAQVLHDRGHEVRVTYFGDGPTAPALRAAASTRDFEVAVPGRVERWFDLLDGETVVLLPSRVEGFGNVFVEAAARGVPSVAVGTALGLADAIVPGVTGVLAATPDPDDLADAVLAAGEVDVAAARHWLANFECAVSTDHLEAALRRAVERATA